VQIAAACYEYAMSEQKKDALATAAEREPFRTRSYAS